MEGNTNSLILASRLKHLGIRVEGSKTSYSTLKCQQVLV